MENKKKSKIHKAAMLTLGILINLKEHISSLVYRQDGRAQASNEEPGEENNGYVGILPNRENILTSKEERDGQLPSDLDYPDTTGSEIAETQPSYAGKLEEELPAGPTGGEGESEIEIPDEIQYDNKEDSGVVAPGHEEGESRINVPEEVQNPDEKDIDLDGSSKKGGKRK
jgi:hypothetical protein